MNLYKKLVLVLSSLAFIGVTGCTVVRGDSTVPQYTSDSAITSAVKTNLVKSNNVSATRVHVETTDGVVLLSGFVKNHREADAAVQAASSVKGVKKVVNYLVIK